MAGNTNQLNDYNKTLIRTMHAGNYTTQHLNQTQLDSHVRNIAESDSHESNRF
jgi:hypothetical protein